MNRKQDELPRLDPGESMLPRKRLQHLQMEAYVYQQATNLQPPLDPPQPPTEPAQPPADVGIAKWPEINIGAVKKEPKKYLSTSPPCINAFKDLEPEIYLC